MCKKLITFFLIGILSNIYANAPQIFRYQGRLIENNVLVNAALPISFKLYDNITDGSLLYEDSATVTIIDGLYSTYIGDDTVSGSISNALAADSVYLEITINGQTLSPREQLVSVPYALNTESSSAPSGSIIMSTNYPDSSLEALGYVPLNETGISLLNASIFDGLGGFEPEFSFNDAIWFKDEDQNQLAKTTDGINFDIISLGSNMSNILDDADWLELNGQLFVIPEHPMEDMGVNDFYNIAISADGENWNIYTNNLYGFDTENAFVWKNYLYVQLQTEGSNVIARSSNGINWSTVFSRANPSMTSDSETFIYTTDDYIFFVHVDDMYSGSETNVYSNDGITWNKTPESIANGENISFHPEDVVTYAGNVWAVQEERNWNYSVNNENFWADADLWKSTDNGISWTEVLELYHYNDSSDIDTGASLYVASNQLWIAIDPTGNLYTLSEDETQLNIQMNSDPGDDYDIYDINGSTIIVLELQAEGNGNDEHQTYSLGSTIKVENGLYYYIKD